MPLTNNKHIINMYNMIQYAYICLYHYLYSELVIYLQYVATRPLYCTKTGSGSFMSLTVQKPQVEMN